MSRQLFGVCMAAIAFAALVALEWPGSATSQDKGGPPYGSIRIKFPRGDDDTVTVTVFREGKALATKDVSLNAGETEFKILPLGTYEVRLECPGWKTLVRRAILTETDDTADLMPRMIKGEGTLVVGPGPSLQELEARIKKLEADVAKLQGK
jgi:hypothetical protein